MMRFKAAIGIILCVLLAACGHVNPPRNSPADTFKAQLVRQQIGETGYDISLPKNYRLKLLPGKDYTIYLFQPKDTTDTISWHGGIFRGNFPGMSAPDSVNFKKDSTLKSPFLDTIRTWLRFSYKTSCEIQVIVPAVYGDGEPTKMYAFGWAPMRDLPKLLSVLSTVQIER